METVEQLMRRWGVEEAKVLSRPRDVPYGEEEVPLGELGDSTLEGSPLLQDTEIVRAS